MNTNMQRVISNLLYYNGMFECFAYSDDFHLRVENPPYLPLVIERHGDDISITHYVESNGDLLRDPEMVFSLKEWEQLSHARSVFRGWVPKSTEPGGFGRVYPTGEIAHFGDNVLKLNYSPRRMKEAIHFATMWAKNLREQGFVQRYTRENISSVTHRDELARALAAKDVPIKIRHHVEQCSDGGELHRYVFPEDLPRKLIRAAYKQAEAALVADWPNWAEYGYGITGEGTMLRTRSLPPCTCGS
jgi:hypothetical protein